MPAEGPSPRLRLIVAGALAVGTAVLVLAISLAGSGEDGPDQPAEVECVDDWNSNPQAVAFGSHLYGVHGYTDVQVMRLTRDGEPPAANQRGRCAMAFASGTPDPEPEAAAQVFDGTTWQAVSSLPNGTPERLAALQAEAVSDANATLGADGKIAAR
jgi:hypothetical protein